ncbi:MAG: adenylyl-sulfate kinase [Chromatiaceae bacterium]
MTAVENLRPEPIGSRPLEGKRILFFGKGGSGKSTLLALVASVLQRKGYRIMVLDGDASNPEGLVRLLFGLGVHEEPKALAEFFGGIQRVTCPVDDPMPLTRIGDTEPVPAKPIRLREEIGPEYYLEKGNLRLLQAGKIESYGQCCDGPLEKVVRDFVIAGDFVSLIDEKAGIEHFGRRIPDRMDILLGVLDCTRESVSIARRVSGFAAAIGVPRLWLVLNKTESQDMADQMVGLLGDLSSKVIGSLPYDPGLVRASLAGRALNPQAVPAEADLLVQSLERIAPEGDECRLDMGL